MTAAEAAAAASEASSAASDVAPAVVGMGDLAAWMAALMQPSTLIELAALAASTLLALATVLMLRRRFSAPHTISFGTRGFDGVLFPLLALAFTYTARVALANLHRVPLLRLAVPVLVSLAVIRLVARVLPLVFPRFGWARVVERVFSWLAWIVAVLWMLGLLPAVMTEMESIEFSFGKSRVSLLSIVQGALSSGLVMVLVLWVSAAVERKLLHAAVADDLSLRKVAANMMDSCAQEGVTAFTEKRKPNWTPGIG